MLESLITRLGAATVNFALKRWQGDNNLVTAGGGVVVDTVVGRLTDHRAQRRVRRQLDDAIDQVAMKLEPVLLVEFSGMSDNERQAAIITAEETVNAAGSTPELVLTVDANPAALRRAFAQADPDGPQRARLNEKGRELYATILKEVANYITEIVISLPEFQSLATVRLLQGQSRLQDLVQQVLTKLPESTGGSGLQLSRAGISFELEYLREIARRWDNIDLFGARLTPIHRRYSLNVAYIPLSVSLEGSANRGGPPDTSIDSARIDDILPRTRRLLLKGEAGSGKTTLLHWMAVSSARRTFRGRLSKINGSVPFIIRLRQFADEPLPTPEEFVALSAPLTAGLMPAGWAHAVLRDGRSLVLVDGMDELPEDARRRATEWLSSLCDTYPRNYFVLTSRPAATEDLLVPPRFMSAELLPMTITDIQLFVDYWHRAVVIAASLDSEAEVPVAHVDTDLFTHRLVANIRQNTSIRRLAANPLLCALICALSEERRSELPNDRIELYRIALEMLIERRDAERGVPADSDRVLPIRDCIILLQDLALWMSTNNVTDAERTSVLARFARTLQAMPHTDHDALTAYRFLVERAGLLREPASGRVDFVHRTFQEYLAARQLVDEDMIGFLLDVAASDRWHETLILTAGLAYSPQRALLIEGLLDRGKGDTSSASVYNILAANCLGVVRELSNDLRDEIELRLRQTLPPRSREEGVRLAPIGDLIIPLLSPLDVRAFSEQEQLATSALLGSLGAEASLPLLQRLASNQNSDVATELGRWWSNFDLLEYASSVLAYASFPEGCLTVETVLLADLAAQLLVNVQCIDVKLSAIESLADLSEVSRVRSLEIRDSSTVREIFHLPRLRSLKALHLSRCSRLLTLWGIDQFASLRQLSLEGMVHVASLEHLGGLTKLSQLEVTSAPNLETTWGLEPLTRLRHLSFKDCGALQDLAGARESVALETLDLSNTGVNDLSPLSTLPRLKFLDISSTDVTDLRPLRNLGHLRRLVARDLPAALPELVDLAIARTEVEVVVGNKTFMAADAEGDSGGMLREWELLPNLVLE